MDDVAVLNPRAVPGNNQPPPDVPDTVEGEVEQVLAPLLDRLATMESRIGALPPIADDVQRGKAIEIGKTARVLLNDVEADFERVKAPYLKASQIVDKEFRGPKQTARNCLNELTSRVGAYDKAKADRLRREAEETARKAREEEQRRAEALRKAEAEGRAAHAAQHQAKLDAAAEEAERAEAVSRQSMQDLTRARTAGGTAVSSSTVWRGEITDRSDPVLMAALWPLLPLDVLQKGLGVWIKNNTGKATTEAPVLPGARIFADVRTRI